MAGAHEAVDRVDTAWLHMEEPANLMVVTLVLTFGRPMPRETLERLVETRLLTLRRFRQRIVERRFRSPCWEDDPDFDVRRHIEPIDLDGAADDASLRRAVSGILSEPLDRNRPLWRFYLVPRYRDGSVLVARVHHCIGDGPGLVHVFMTLADGPLPTNDGASRPRAGLLGRALGGGATAARLLAMGFDPSTGLKGPLSRAKRAAWSVPSSLERVKAVSHAIGLSVNDVLLAAVTGALRRTLLTRGEVDDRLVVRGVVPVNLRPAGDARTLGNRFGLLFVPLPVGMPDPAARLSTIGRCTRRLKQSYEPRVTFQILRGLGAAPRRLSDLVVALFGRKATVVVTNVSGPREPVTYAGVPLTNATFWVPCAGRLGVGVSLLSYAGRVSVGFATDAGLIPDPEVLVDGFERELCELSARAQERVGA